MVCRPLIRLGAAFSCAYEPYKVMNIPKRNNTAKDRLINEIVEREWEMFTEVPNLGGRASCQDDSSTFYIMRFSQHNAFAMDTLQSYMGDLTAALAVGRNLLTEKYGYMMEDTDPEYFYSNLKEVLPPVSEKKLLLVEQISALASDCYSRFATRYPAVSALVRPQSAGPGVATIRIYNEGEFKTYSEETLAFVLRDYSAGSSRCDRAGVSGSVAPAEYNIIEVIQESIMGFYGFQSLAEAEGHFKSAL